MTVVKKVGSYVPWYLYRMGEIYSIEGGTATIKGITDFIRNRDILRRYYVNYRYNSDVNRYNIIQADPFMITKEVRYKDRYISPGVVYDGPWDQLVSDFTDRIIPRSLINHFENGVDWKHTKYYQKMKMRVRYGREYRGCSSIENLPKYFESYDKLFEHIKSNGYELTSDLEEGDKITEVGVSIGRKGKLYWQREGQHRLMIAQILGIEKIPVQVTIRHKKWQAIRDRIKSADRLDALDEEIVQHLNHPDLVDITPEPWLLSE